MGFAKGHLAQEREYEPIILAFRFGRNINWLFEKINLKQPGVLQLNIESFLNPVIGPDNNVEFGQACLPALRNFTL
ncbi:MAG: hypothetical protein V1674_06495 [Candidatus Omnitrophota bacterium]